MRHDDAPWHAAPLTRGAPANDTCVYLSPFPQVHLGPQAHLLTLPAERREAALWLLHGLREAWSPGLALSLPRLLRDMRPQEHARVLQAFADLLQAGSLLISLAARGDDGGEG